MRPQIAAGVDVQALAINGYLHDLQPSRPQDMLDRLVAGRLDPAAIPRIGKHFRRQFHRLLRARRHEDLIGRCPGAAHRRGMRGNRFVNRIPRHAQRVDRYFTAIGTHGVVIFRRRRKELGSKLDLRAVTLVAALRTAASET
jgi:hypothetical protein